MRVLKSKFVRVLLVLVLVLSFSISSAFATSSSKSFPFPQPPANDTQGYVIVETANGACFVYWWNTSLYGQTTGDNDNNDSVVVNLEVNSNSIVFEFEPLGSYLYYNYNICYGSYAGNGLYVLRSGDSAGTMRVSDTFPSSSIVGITYYGNVGTVSTYTSLRTANATFGSDETITSGLNSVLSSLGTINSKVSLSYDVLSSLYDLFETYPNDISNIIRILTNIDTDTSTIISILREWASTSLDESTSPLPNQGLNDFESSQSSLRNDTDVSSSLDNVFNSVDFGSFSNGFSAIWSLVDGILYSHPIFFTLVILVLSLGLLNLIFNRR